MALITDPDSLSQGFVTAVTNAIFATGTGADIRIHSGGSNYLPALAVGEFFEVRDHSNPVNNGLYVVVTVTASTDDYECDKITGSAPATAGGEAITTLGKTGTADEKSVHYDTDTRLFYLLEQGNLSSDGVTMLAFHSFTKEEWKDDDTLPMHPFPMIGIDFDAGKWEFGTDPSGNYNGWVAADDDATNGIYTRRLFRNAGWNEYDDAGVLLARYANITTLGSFEDTANDKAYYALGDDPTDTGAAIDFIYAGPVNEAIKFYEEIGDLSGDSPSFATTSTITRTSGSFVTDGFLVGGQVTVQGSTSNDGTYVLTDVAALTLTVTGTPLTVEAWGTSHIAVNNDNVFNAFLRIRDADPNGKTYSQASLIDGGESALVNKVIKVPLANATDLNISESDANIAANSPYTQILIRYFDQAFSRKVDSAVTARDFGIVVDVGTHSGVDGSAPGGGSVLTTAEGGMTVGQYNGGTLRIHEGTDADLEFPIVSNDATTITVTGTLSSGSNISFTAQRASAIVATKNEIYEKIQYLLRQAADIDSTDQTVNGKTADALLNFVGPDLNCGFYSPSNPNGGGSGVIIEGFKADDTNNLYFYDNGGTKRNYPFVAAGTLNFNQNLVLDSDPYYWLFYEYTTRTNLTDGAIVGPSGNVADLESPGGNLPSLSVNDYIKVDGFANDVNNGVYIVTVVNTDTQDYTVRKLDGETLIAESGVTIDVDEHPIDSDGAIIVDNNAGSDIAGAVTAAQISFDYDYDNNVQGGRASGTDASVILIAIGLETGQYVRSTAYTITRATGLSFTATASLERNYAT
jgi:hypothetical protein